MSVPRRRPERAQPDAPAAGWLERQIADPSTSELRRRQLQRRLDSRLTLTNGRAYGRTDLKNPGERPSDTLAMERASAEEIRDHRRTVSEEISACRERIAHLSRRIDATPLTVASEEFAEARRERRLLGELIEDLRADRPITAWPSGRAVTPQVRAAIASRAHALAEDKFDEADRLARTGQWRESTAARVDGCRSRLLIEFEDGLRAELRGYSTPWS